MKRFYYELSGQKWAVRDRLCAFGNGTVCHVEDPEVANIICNALNDAYPQRREEA